MTLTGILADLVLKNKSTDLAKIPPALSIRIVSATGSIHSVVSLTCVSTRVLS